MLQTIEVRFPPSVTTVGQAIAYLLAPSGYTLAPVKKASSAVKDLFHFTLPIADRNFGPMTLQLALQTLVGDSYALHIDHLTRQVSFSVRTH